jgi:ribokinase
VVVVFGSVNVDLLARVARLPAFGETLAAQAFAVLPGGKGANQALAARRAGADVHLVGCVGRDALAVDALGLLRAGAVDLAGVHAVDASTGLALVHVAAGGNNAITIVPGANAAARAAQVPDALLGPRTVLLMQLEVDATEVAALARRARGRGARVILNAAPMARLPGTLLDDTDVLLMNETEAAALAADVEAPGIPELCRLLGGEERVVIVTRGAGGAMYWTAGEMHARAAPAVQVVDTVGAGDAFAGALAAALDRGADLDRAVSEALAAGALACTAAGAQPALPSRERIRVLADTL